MTDEESGEPFIARRAESMDSDGVAVLVKRHTESVFGRFNVDDIIEKANLAITLAGKDEKVLAFAAFYDHPSVKKVEQSEWEEWLPTTCECPQANPLNSLFLRLFVSEEDFSQAALAELLRTVFVAVPFLQYVLLPVASNVSIGPSLSAQFSPLPNPDSEEPPHTTIYLSQRHQHYPMLHTRPAVVEDNDDLLPILQQCSPQGLSTQYGDYFIAEIIESQDESHQTVVAEANGRAIGFISVTTEVDLSVLWDCYQLEAYHGLHKPCEEDQITTVSQVEKDTSITSGRSSLSSFKQGSISQQDSSEEDTEKQAVQEKPQEETSSSSIGGLSLPVDEPQEASKSPAPATPIPVSQHKKNYLFKGSSNVISVQLFCMDEQYEARSIDLLPAVFQKFQDLDFLIISQPQNILEFPLLQHFTRVPPRVDSTLSHDLYVMHKCSLLDSFSVRPIEDKDVAKVRELAESLEAEESIIEDIQRCLLAGRDPISEGGIPLHAFVAECLDQIVGVVVLRQVKDLSYLRSHYNIEDYVYFSQHLPEEYMNIHHLLLSPAFVPHLKHFMKESMRLSHSNNLYYPLTSSVPSKSPPFSLTLALGEMVPIRPRRQIVYPNDLSINIPGKDVMEERPLYTLYHTNRKLSMEPKIVINAHIVFVGASDVSLSALETLIFSPHLKFNNLTLVSPHGLPQGQISTMLPDSCCFLNNALRGVSLDAWVSVVSGTLISINRESSEISITMTDDSEVSTVPYDYLVISTGLRYVPENPRCGEIPHEGVFGIQGNQSDIPVMREARETVGMDGDVVVYGSSLSTLSFIHHLMDKWSIHGSQVVLVQPPRTASGPLLPITVQTLVDQSLDSAGVRTLKGYTIDQYDMTSSSEGSSKLTGLVCVKENETSQGKKEEERIILDCKVVFCLEHSDVDKKTFKAVNDACLVYDNRIVIDTEYCTNDKHILAAGSVTKYSRYFRTEWSHVDFSSREVGQRLAGAILSKLDPTMQTQDDTFSQSEEKDLIPTYHQPKVLYTQLPGGYYYLNVCKPHLEGQAVESDEGTELFTNTDDNGYFRLYINQYERIQTITVFSKKPFEVSNYLCLYNVHEKLLNDMVSRWNDNLITDFFLYFREQWTCAIFHDRFTDFLLEVRDLLEKPVQGEDKSLMEKTRDIVEDSGQVSVKANVKKFLGLSDDLRNSLNKRLHRYLHYNGYHLTMYAHPDML